MKKAKAVAKAEVIRELTTLRDMLRWSYSELQAANLYYGHGTTNAWDEAVYLNLHALHLTPELNTEFLDAKLLAYERNQIVELVLRRIRERQPAPYLTHEAWFAGLPFYVDERVLIPRSPIAELIEKQFSPWIAEESVSNILDLCTGSGCIAIACAYAFPEAMVDATDISKSALAVAKINLEKHSTLNNQVRLIQSDLFAKLTGNKYDIIVSNPPYVDAQDMKSLPVEYKHEPKLALQAGNDGLKIVKAILEQAKNYLNPHGVLIVEVGNSEAALVNEYPAVPFTWLEFEQGDSAVFLLSAEQLAQYF